MILQEQQTNDTTIQEHECVDFQCPGNCPLCPFSTYEFSSTINKDFRPFDVEW